MRLEALVALALLAAVAAACDAAADEARGPFDLRDAQLFAQPRLVLRPSPARGLSPGRTLVGASLAWGNTFAWAQDQPGETPRARRYLIDGEALTLDLELRRGLSERLELGLRLPLHARGGGLLDGCIDAFHRAFRFAGVGDGERPRFRRDALRVLGRTPEGRAFDWGDDASGVGLGDLELGARVRLAREVAALARLSLPSGTRPFDGNGLALGAQLVGSRALGERADLHLGAGLTAGGSRAWRGVRYARLRGQAFAVLERRVGARVSLIAGSEIATRLARGVDGFPGLRWTAHAGAWLDLGRRARLALALVENIAAQAATADVTLHARVELRR